LTILFSLRANLLPIVAVLLGLALPTFGQGAASVAATTAAFDVVSIKPNKTGSGSISIDRDFDRISATNVPLKTLILMAYELKMEDQIQGLPSWGHSASFDIEAKADADTMAALKGMTEEAKEQASDNMMKAMLEDRFHLKVHHETRELPTYSLVVAKGGSKLKAADPERKNNGSMSQRNQSLTATGIPIAELCTFLSRQSHRKVEDKTGLAGKYDLTLKWAPDEIAGQQDAAGDVMPSLFTALQEQLGLKVESSKGPVDTIVIDHVEPPTEN
jgi:uncharacterized protein (TIGR03435 family)